MTYLGEVLIESARDPEFEACRALLARGVRGTLAIFSRGSAVPRARVDIEEGAKLTTIDNATKGPRTGQLPAAPGPRRARRKGIAFARSASRRPGAFERWRLLG